MNPHSVRKVAPSQKELDTHVLLRRGDLVEVRSASEIMSTLDVNGTLDGLPFMPEMTRFIGKRFRVALRVEKTCHDYPSHTFRRFKRNDVVFLEELRCSGEAHGGCQRGCRIFWKEAWLRKVKENEDENYGAVPLELPPERLKTIGAEGNYFCQSSELTEATEFLNSTERLKVIVAEVRVGNKSLPAVLGLLLQTVVWKVVSKLYGTHPRGRLKKTPTEALNLQSGDWVQVKSYEEIYPTLDVNGRNRGMKFELDMRMFCGKKFRVLRRLDYMIREGTGKMLNPTNTVILEDVNCQCVFAVGGCPRAEAYFWREIWLKRISSP